MQFKLQNAYIMITNVWGCAEVLLKCVLCKMGNLWFVKKTEELH